MNDLEEKPSEGLPAVLESLNKFAETQALEVEIKRQELVVKEKEIESNERIALKSIDVQAAAQATKYDKFNKHLIHRYVFIGCIVLMILTFAGFALVYGAKELVLDSLKILLGFAAGIFGGFNWGKSKKNSEQP